MTLRVRLNLLVTAIFVTLVVFGAGLAIYNARVAIDEETGSAAVLAVELLDSESSLPERELNR